MPSRWLMKHWISSKIMKTWRRQVLQQRQQQVATVTPLLLPTLMIAKMNEWGRDMNEWVSDPTLYNKKVSVILHVHILVYWWCRSTTDGHSIELLEEWINTSSRVVLQYTLYYIHQASKASSEGKQNEWMSIYEWKVLVGWLTHHIRSHTNYYLRFKLDNINFVF